MAEHIIMFPKVNKWYGNNFHVLKDIDLDVGKGERIVICGPSGSGKSTLIRCINRLEEHQQGQIIVDKVELTNDLKNIDAIRREVGMVFQHFNLFPHLTVLDNLTLAPIWVRKTPKREAEETAMHFLRKVKIPEQADKYPGQLSGGQQQRVAVARALVARPEIIFADEPTGNLDSNAGQEVLQFLRRAVDDWHQTVVMVTHDPSAAAIADVVLFLRDGQFVGELERPTADDILNRIRQLEV